MGATVTGAVAGATSVLDWAVTFAAAPGERACGDQHVVEDVDGTTLLGIVDGLGHGDEAAAVARRAVGTLAAHAGDSLIRLLHRCHGALRGTRGAVMTLARIDPHDDTLTWLSVGNAGGVLQRTGGTSEPRSERVLVRPGIVGVQLPHLQAMVLQLARGDTLTMATDGIRPEFADEWERVGEPRELVEHIMNAYRHPSDDALVLAARYHGGGRGS